MAAFAGQHIVVQQSQVFRDEKLMGKVHCQRVALINYSGQVEFIDN